MVVVVVAIAVAVMVATVAMRCLGSASGQP